MDNFRQAVRSGTVLVGTFIKTASHQVVEVLGVSGFDFAVADCEHAPFDPQTLDTMALAARAVNLPCLVRVPQIAYTPISQTLDMGFAGILAPHAKNLATANAVLDSAKYNRGQRGLSPSTRAGGYGAQGAAAYRQEADRRSTVWCQIEDKEALSELDAIAALDEIDCLFIGRADLAQSLGVDSQNDSKVVEAVTATATAGRRHNRTIGIFIGDVAEVPELLAQGITVFVCGSDQSLLKTQGQHIHNEMRKHMGLARKR